MKYEALQNDVFSIFNSVGWIAEDVRTFPQNALISGNLSEFIRVSIVASGPSLNENSVSGVIQAEIFTAFNEGPTRTSQIADKLDKFLSKVSINTLEGRITQTRESSLVYWGVDKDNPGLVKSTLSVPFTYFGVT